MYTLNQRVHSRLPVSFDPTEGSSHVGYREIVGKLPSSGETRTLLAWAVVFDYEIQALHHYQLL